MSENIKVVVRCRPMNRSENENKCENIVEINEYAVSVTNPSARLAPKKMFIFDSAYDMITKTDVIYNEMCYSLVESTIEGYNGTIFAYGQTGCGKTHTMQVLGNENLSSGSGIIPKCFDHIFETISMANNVRYLALVSYLEIYNENIRDLLNTNESTSMINHSLKEIPGIGVSVPTLTTHPVISANQCYDWLNLGNKNRVTAATLMNEKSSRSHTIFTITLEQSPFFNSIATENDLGGIRRGKLSLVDLAGSERQRKTGAQGDRLKEASKINLSLSALGNVISSLVDGKAKHVPFRDSKLTRLLQDSLGGNTKTLMISCISPSDISYDETISTLRYASRAKNISNRPIINEDPKDAKLRQYQNEILNLKRMLEETQQKMLYRNDEKIKLVELPMAILNVPNLNSRKEDQISESGEDHDVPLKTINSISIKPSHSSIQSKEEMQLQARSRIDFIKRTLVGGERVDDFKLKEQHKARKFAAQRHLSAIAYALSRVKCEDRDLLQGHYATITQEINIKNNHIKNCKEKIKMLEMEVSDLSSEFQLDREDYLDEIRNLGRHIKFYQQLVYKLNPSFPKNGKNWTPDILLRNSSWNDELKIWRIPEIDSFKLPPATPKSGFHRIHSSTIDSNNVKHINFKINRDAKVTEKYEKNENTSKEKFNIDVQKNYFRTSRQKYKEFGEFGNTLQRFKGVYDTTESKQVSSADSES
ncbi:osmotic avoidance abnormal protein 3 isoform X3 [Drosophila subpulchrella]|uniref:osmotic avoidance abnormal protein 3 isoform X3 n=1 Tax=Drosophila subpulchrella TaxID=1486046 RepID=UPI0018A1B4EF|nr:osmotic avoidance abnormal protein 3 isoform X3 [Drosophila subpulchrella]